jgi:erythromycin esterase-like protein
MGAQRSRQPFSPSDPTMGRRLSGLIPNGYYPIGFFFGEGSSRAWDPAAAIGVISHAIKPPPSYSLEGVMLAATSGHRPAWLAFAGLPDRCAPGSRHLGSCERSERCTTANSEP